MAKYARKSFKTVYEFESAPKVGDFVLLYSVEREDGGKAEWHTSTRYAESGYPGNMNREIRRFHGWRGTSYGKSIYAWGVRPVLSIEKVGEDEITGEAIYSVTVGDDVKKDEE